tara:strand:- start:457 stop:663 length:207 start_codon:yes stop_codon:yes gene_type:complete
LDPKRLGHLGDFYLDRQMIFAGTVRQVLLHQPQGVLSQRVLEAGVGAKVSQVIASQPFSQLKTGVEVL